MGLSVLPVSAMVKHLDGLMAGPVGPGANTREQQGFETELSVPWGQVTNKFSLLDHKACVGRAGPSVR